MDGHIKSLCVSLQVQSENVDICLRCCVALLALLTLVFFHFRQYKDKEEENQGGFFSTLSSMVGSYSYYIFLLKIYFQQMLFVCEDVCYSKTSICGFLSSADGPPSVHRWAACL